MMRPKTLACSAFWLVASKLLFAQYPGDIGKIIRDECDSLLSNQEIESVSVGVINKGTSYKYHMGKLANGEVPSHKTLYEIASLTKTFTGTLLALAILDKKVAIDDDIRAYLPGEFPNLEFDGQAITFRHLVTHTSGLPHMFPDTAGIFDRPDWDRLPFIINSLQAGFTRNQFLKELRKVQLDTIPGHTFRYSNAGANLVGYCLEQVYGRPYEVLVDEYIFNPLGMNHTYMDFSGKNAQFLARGANSSGLAMPPRARKELNAEGGIISNLDDMIRYMQFHLQQDHPIIQIAHQELMNGKYGDFENGLFWQVFKNGNQARRIFQNGGAFGTSCWMTLLPESGIGVFIVTNVSGPEVHQKLSAAADHIIHRLK